MSEPIQPAGKRLFVGFRVAVPAANSLASAVETLSRRTREAGLAAKWVPTANYHVTLKFLGFTRPEAVIAVRDAVETAVVGTPPMKVKIARIGGFASLEKATVIWAGVEDLTGGLADLAARIDRGAVALGYPAEPRSFHPHVTLARLRESRPVKEAVLPLAEQMFGDTRVEGVAIFESETKSAGSAYKELHRIAFKVAGNSGSGVPERQTGAVDLGASKALGEPDTDDGWPRGHVPNG